MHPYATLTYAKTLAHLGRPVWVPAWQTHVIAREWKPGVFDAIGPYPLTCLAEESDIGLGFEDLRNQGLISVTLVVDGLLGPPLSSLQETFTFARPFKTHYLVDERVAAYRPSKHHRYEIRRATQRGVEIKLVDLKDLLDAWTALYGELISRRSITGMQRFSRDSFEALATCDGLATVAGFIDQELVSCHLWFRSGEFVWSHLAASGERGYASGAAYAVYDQSIHHFSGCVVNLGGAAGIGDRSENGLARFKAGFSNRTNTTYVLGEVLDQATYNHLCNERGATTAAEYFPAYRAPDAGESPALSVEATDDGS